MLTTTAPTAHRSPVKALAALVVAVLASATITMAAPTAASARPICERSIYKITNVSKSSKMTNLQSDYLRGPGTINYTATKTGSVTATASASVTAEAGVVFAKASATAGVSLGKTWSKAGSWSYTKPVPAGKTARLVMMHETRRFTVTKLQADASCRYSTVYSSSVNAPVIQNLNVWTLDYA